MTSRAVLLAQARQGNPVAIAALINQSLKLKSATVQVRQKGELYQILVQVPDLPNQAKIVQWLTRGLTKLDIPNLNQVVIWGKAITAPKPAWQERVELAAPSTTAIVQSPGLKNPTAKLRPG